MLVVGSLVTPSFLDGDFELCSEEEGFFTVLVDCERGLVGVLGLGIDLDGDIDDRLRSEDVSVWFEVAGACTKSVWVPASQTDFFVTAAAYVAVCLLLCTIFLASGKEMFIVTFSF